MRNQKCGFTDLLIPDSYRLQTSMKNCIKHFMFTLVFLCKQRVYKQLTSPFYKKLKDS